MIFFICETVQGILMKADVFYCLENISIEGISIFPSNGEKHMNEMQR